MIISRFVRLLAVVLLGVSTTIVAVVGSSAPASAETGGCPDRPHKVHTSDTAPYRAWACFIDDGDKIRVCDNAPNDGVHAHAELAIDFQIGVWYTFIREDDGADDGCDDQAPSNGDDLDEGTHRLRLKVCAQRDDQSNFACDSVIWYEYEAS